MAPDEDAPVILPFVGRAADDARILSYAQSFDVEGRSFDLAAELWPAGECPHPHGSPWPFDPSIVLSVSLRCPISGEVFWPSEPEAAARLAGSRRTLPVA